MHVLPAVYPSAAQQLSSEDVRFISISPITSVQPGNYFFAVLFTNTSRRLFSRSPITILCYHPVYRSVPKFHYFNAFQSHWHGYWLSNSCWCCQQWGREPLCRGRIIYEKIGKKINCYCSLRYKQTNLLLSSRSFAKHLFNTLLRALVAPIGQVLLPEDILGLTHHLSSRHTSDHPLSAQ